MVVQRAVVVGVEEVKGFLDLLLLLFGELAAAPRSRCARSRQAA
jgi:hypothetical protein